jgi:uncharacterized membrane protein YgcG
MSVSTVILNILGIAVVANLIYMVCLLWLRRRNDGQRLSAVDFQGGQIEGDYERKARESEGHGDVGPGASGRGGSFAGGDGGGGSG